MKRKEVLIESLRIASALILSSFFLFLIREFGFLPIDKESFFLLEWLGAFAVCSLFLVYTLAIILLDRKEIKKVNYKDYKVYMYSILLIVSIYLILILFFG